MASAEESYPVGSTEGFEVSKTEDSVVHGNDDDGTPPPGIITDANCLDESVFNHDRKEEGETEDVEGIQERVSSISLTSAQVIYISHTYFLLSSLIKKATVGLYNLGFPLIWAELRPTHGWLPFAPMHD